MVQDLGKLPAGMPRNVALLVAVAIGGFAGAARAQDSGDKKNQAPPARAPSSVPPGSGKTLLDRKDTRIDSKPPSTSGTPGTPSTSTQRAPGLVRRNGSQPTYDPGLWQDSAAGIGPIFDISGNRSGAQIVQALTDDIRAGRTPHTNQEIQDLVKPVPPDLTAVRREALSQGFMEKKLTDDKVVFVKAQGWDDANRIVDNLRRQLAQEASAQTDERTLCCDPHRLYHAIPVSDTSATSVDPFVLGKRDKDRAGAPETSGKDDEPMSLLESADRDLRSGLAAKAIQEYQDHLKSNPEDGAAMRSLGVALMQSRRAAEGVAKISAAYEMDPTLAARPLDASALNDGDTVLRDLVPAAVAQAHRARSGGPWIAVAALMQAQGRTEAAARMVARAKENGAPEKVIAEFALALEGALASREVAK